MNLEYYTKDLNSLCLWARPVGININSDSYFLSKHEILFTVFISQNREELRNELFDQNSHYAITLPIELIFSLILK